MEVLFGAADTRSQHSRETKINIEQKRPIVEGRVRLVTVSRILCTHVPRNA